MDSVLRRTFAVAALALGLVLVAIGWLPREDALAKGAPIDYANIVVVVWVGQDRLQR